MRTMLHSVYSWVDERLGLEELLHFAQKKAVPEHRHSFWYYWGGISLFFFLVQAVSGVLLLTGFCMYRVLTLPPADVSERMKAPLEIDTRDTEDAD